MVVVPAIRRSWAHQPSERSTSSSYDAETNAAHTKERHVSLELQWEETSSNEYRMPPMGALKAAATPATAPVAIHSR